MILPPDAKKAPRKLVEMTFIEQLEVVLANRREGHDPRVVNHDVDAREFRTGFIEEPLDIRRARNIRWNVNSIAADPLEFCHDFFSFRCVAHIVHNNRETILGQPLRHCPPYSTNYLRTSRSIPHHTTRSRLLSLTPTLTILG
jgi:hypothetical protein